ncbi:MAG: prephenate dehydrogenase [Anaerolineaceae bacterium]|nr:prephenate dehydrogenase [Anaerolineaceae bacterium]
MTIQFTIIGLGQIGASLGLALSDQKDKLTRVGHDSNPTNARAAEKIGAVDRTTLRLQSAVEEADIVVLALPVDEIHKTLEFIAPDLKEGCVVLDTSPVKVSSIKWAEELLPEGRYYVTFSPTINPDYLMEIPTGTEAAKADLFKNSVMVITSSVGTEGEAIKLATDLTKLVGATPYFADPYEADGLTAAADLLPKLTAAAIILATQNQPGWRETRKLAAHAYALGTTPLLHMNEVKEFGTFALANKENASRVLGDLINELQIMKEQIDQEDAAGLQKSLEKALDGRSTWLSQRQKAEWGTLNLPEVPSAKEMLGRLIGLRPGRKEKK